MLTTTIAIGSSTGLSGSRRLQNSARSRAVRHELPALSFSADLVCSRTLSPLIGPFAYWKADLKKIPRVLLGNAIHVL
jgi:hypothetical protein